MELGKIVGLNIQNLRKSHNMTQKDLAAMFNYTANAVSKWERGETLPEIATLKAIANKFGVTVDCLLEENGYKQADEYQSSSRQLVINIIQAVLGSSLVWTIVTILFVYLYQNDVDRAWVALVWGIPVSAFAPAFIYRNEKRPILRFILGTIIIWGILSAVYLQYYSLHLELIFLVGLPAEISLFFWSRIINIRK